MKNFMCKLFGHKLIVALIGPNWFDSLCTRCGKSNRYVDGFR